MGERITTKQWLEEQIVLSIFAMEKQLRKLWPSIHKNVGIIAFELIERSMEWGFQIVGKNPFRLGFYFGSIKVKWLRERVSPETLSLSLSDVWVIPDNPTCGLFLKIVVHNFLRCSGRSMASDVGLEPPGSSAIRGGCKKADELCRRVLTTSRGHVTTAPTVPATLK